MTENRSQPGRPTSPTSLSEQGWDVYNSPESAMAVLVGAYWISIISFAVLWEAPPWARLAVIALAAGAMQLVVQLPAQTIRWCSGSYRS